MPFLLEPFTTDFMLRALLGGSLCAAICAVVGTWVVVRGMAFLGEAMAHGMLPGVALATLAGVPVVLGAACSAIIMSLGVSFLARRGRLSHDTSIGLFFVGMLAAGVAVISHSRSFATDATAVLFGDVLAIGPGDLWLLAGALLLTVLVAAAFHRAFTALAFDRRIAQVLGLRPRLAQVLLVGLVTLAVVVSYQAVGALLVLGLLLAPAVAAAPWTTRIPHTMCLAALIGAASVLLGLLASWHVGTAAGASIALAAIGCAAVSNVIRSLVRRRPPAPPVRIRRPLPGKPLMRTPAALLLSLPLIALATTSCTPATPSGDTPAVPGPGPASAPPGDGHGTIEGSVEATEPQLHLMTTDPAGSVDLLDLADGTTVRVGELPEISSTTTDGRYLFASSAATGTMTVVDSGMWTWDHEDHFHYYRGEPRIVGSVEGVGQAVVTPGAATTGVFFPDSGHGLVLDNDALAQGELSVRADLSTEPHRGLLVPLSDVTLLTRPGVDGAAATVRAYDAEGLPLEGVEAECDDARGTITTPVGTVIGCDDGALLATLDGGAVGFERIPYPPGAGAPKATGFRAREGRPTVAAVAGDQGAWLLDTRERSWQFVPSEVPLLQVSAVDDGEGHVVALAADGRVLVLSAETGGTIAATGPLLVQTLTDPELLAGVELTTDQQRAYLNAPAERTLFEIDFADGARIARSFDTDTVPAHLAEVGR
ncbi:zinc ABC transporter permease AztB [Arthrobacter sp. MDT1-65]